MKLRAPHCSSFLLLAALAVATPVQAGSMFSSAHNDDPGLLPRVLNWLNPGGEAEEVPLLAQAGAEGAPLNDEIHAAVMAENYPSANACAKCHEHIYNEWRGSAHAYASISPMFHKFEQTINNLSQGTIGSFCLRCHATVGTTLGEERHLALWDRSPVSREGITCITCHRIEEKFYKANGERRIIPGPATAPIFGPFEGDGVAQAIQELPDVTTKMGIHGAGIMNDQMDKSEFCLSCHQVAVHPGIKLEVVWDQYRGSPAVKEGISCQDCHMSTEPGLNSGYAEAHVAVINGKPFGEKRKHANHKFVGPGYPIAHPGIFPHNVRAEEIIESCQEGVEGRELGFVNTWLKFDYMAGWGSDEFEDNIPEGYEFPEEWADEIVRMDAWEVVQENMALIEEKKEDRRALMENGSHLDGPFFKSDPRAGRSLRFKYKVTNLNNGHNLPSGSLGAQPELWLNVALIDPDGETVWESGHLDSYGDFMDNHSLDVAAGEEPDHQLFNLQTKFLTTNVKGTDREMYLPVNMDVDQIPFIRPANVPTTVLNHPPLIRMEGRSIPPLGHKYAHYRVPAEKMQKSGTYRLAARMRSRAEPIYFMKFVGATDEMIDEMNKWMLDVHPYTVEFEVE